MKRRPSSAYLEYKRRQRGHGQARWLLALAGFGVMALVAGAIFVLFRSSRLILSYPQSSITAVAKIITLPASGDGKTEPSRITPTLVLQDNLATSQPSEFNAALLAKSMLALINNDRRANGLNEVAWDELAARVGEAHAVDMAQQGYFSHWNTQGIGPDIRYAQAGGTDVVAENLFRNWWRYPDGKPAPVTNWNNVVKQAEEGLMNSPGHRANILDPYRTHVGVGVTYNPKTGNFMLAQEFINRHVVMHAVPQSVKLGQIVQVEGTLLENATNPMINVAFEPASSALSIDELMNKMPHIYSSAAKNTDAMQPQLTGQNLSAQVQIGSQGAGVYHIRIWVNVRDEIVPAADLVVVAR